MNRVLEIDVLLANKYFTVSNHTLCREARTQIFNWY
jgi:hypothetical protein